MSNLAKSSKSRKSTVRVAASVALVAGATAVAGLGTFGSFTSSTDAAQVVSSGETKLTMTDQGTQGLSMAAEKLVPGDTVQRAVQLVQSDKTEGFGSVKLSTTSSVNSLLTSDAVNGLQLSIDQCSVAWVKSATKAMTCPAGGTVTPVLASRGAVGTDLDLAVAKTSLNAGKTSNLRFTLTLPNIADDKLQNTFQNLGTTMNFVFTATQRDAEAR